METIQKKAAELLDNGTVEGIWGYAQGTHPLVMSPILIETPDEIDKLTFNPFCYHTLPNYLHEFKNRKVAVFVKKCDLAAVNILIREQQLKRDDMYLIAIDCGQLIDFDSLSERVNINDLSEWQIKDDKFFWGEKSVPLSEIIVGKCQDCKYQEMDSYDELLPYPQKIEITAKIDDILSDYEKLEIEKRWQEWTRHFENCIQCFACRQVCPMCYCTECIANKDNPRLIPQSVGSKQNTVWQITRIMHLVGRCTDCGECERVCPAKIPLRRLTLKMRQIVNDYYKYVPGLDPEQDLFWSSYSKKDPEYLIYKPEEK